MASTSLLDNIVAGSGVLIQVLVRSGMYGAALLVNVDTVVCTLSDPLGNIVVQGQMSNLSDVCPLYPSSINVPIPQGAQTGVGVWTCIWQSATNNNLGTYTAYFTSTDASGIQAISTTVSMFNLVTN